MNWHAPVRAWSTRAERAHGRRPWAGVAVASLVALAGITAAAAEEPAPDRAASSAPAAAPSSTTTTTQAPVTETTVEPESAPATTAVTAPPPLPTSIPASEGTEVIDGVVVPVLPAPTTTIPPAPPPTAAPGPGDPPVVRAECTPGYDPCIRPGDDVDCEGTGDGPRFVRGPIYVEGDDSYGLDADGDGVACDAEPNF